MRSGNDLSGDVNKKIHTFLTAAFGRLAQCRASAGNVSRRPGTIGNFIASRTRPRSQELQTRALHATRNADPGLGPGERRECTSQPAPHLFAFKDGSQGSITGPSTTVPE
jgi:hypothetical protein